MWKIFIVFLSVFYFYPFHKIGATLPVNDPIEKSPNLQKTKVITSPSTPLPQEEGKEQQKMRLDKASERADRMLHLKRKPHKIREKSYREK
ncbi:MAG: hypothetical protein IBJ00_00205 [Alphaproteobacteria bacterium]|nr:hypothetical protein [Alphaproteobacteria bacterium]